MPVLRTLRNMSVLVILIAGGAGCNGCRIHNMICTNSMQCCEHACIDNPYGIGACE
jgi:hypothetical protein